MLRGEVLEHITWKFKSGRRRSVFFRATGSGIAGGDSLSRSFESRYGTADYATRTTNGMCLASVGLTRNRNSRHGDRAPWQLSPTKPLICRPTNPWTYLGFVFATLISGKWIRLCLSCQCSMGKVNWYVPTDVGTMLYTRIVLMT